GIDFRLQGRLEGLAAEADELVADLLLARVDDLARGGLVDGLSDALADILEAATQGLRQGFRRQRGQGVHSNSGRDGTREKSLARRHSRDGPEDLPRPKNGGGGLASRGRGFRRRVTPASPASGARQECLAYGSETRHLASF